MISGQARIDFDEYIENNSLCVVSGINMNTFYDFPFHMQYGMIQNFFRRSGIIIDSETPNNIYKVWDYRKEEPEEPYTLDVTYSDSYAQGICEVVELVSKIYNNEL